MNLSNFSVGAWWPLLLLVSSILGLFIYRARNRGSLFPDVGLLKRSALAGGVVDRLPLLLGGLVGALLLLSLMNITATRLVELDRQARDFLVVVDTSRSMREDTALLREQFPPTYERKADLYVGQSEDPANIPNLGRYEVARESLLQYLSTRRDVDRVGLIYFNSMIYLMSGFTSNFEFIEQQLAGMDSYVTYGTNMRWALEQALDLVERYPGRNRRAIILLTDAEARNTDFLQKQLERLRSLDIAFYLLWITPETATGESALASDFLRTVRSIGSVYTIDDIGEGYLDEALDEIAELEDYAYKEASHSRVDVSKYLLSIALWLMLLWVLMMGTLWLPLAGISYANSREAS